MKRKTRHNITTPAGPNHDRLGHRGLGSMRGSMCGLKRMHCCGLKTSLTQAFLRDQSCAKLLTIGSAIRAFRRNYSAPAKIVFVETRFVGVAIVCDSHVSTSCTWCSCSCTRHCLMGTAPRTPLRVPHSIVQHMFRVQYTLCACTFVAASIIDDICLQQLQ